MARSGIFTALTPAVAARGDNTDTGSRDGRRVLQESRASNLHSVVSV